MTKSEAQDKLKSLDKEREALRKIIEAPTDIISKINNYADILEISGLDESADEIKVTGFDEAENKVVKNFIKKMRICKVYNEGIIPKRGEQRWYNWYDVSSGFVFRNYKVIGF